MMISFEFTIPFLNCKDTCVLGKDFSYGDIDHKTNRRIRSLHGYSFLYTASFYH